MSPSAAKHESSPTTRFEALEQLVRHLGDELAAFRRRALTAEARLEALETAAAADAAVRQAAGDEPLHPRVAELEAENAELRRRLEHATQRTRDMLSRVRFLRQQQSPGGDR